MSTPHHFHRRVRSAKLNWTNDIGDIDCLCNWPKYYFPTFSQSIKQTIALGVADSTFAEVVYLKPKKPGKTGPKPKQIGLSDYCRICGFLFNTSIILGNHPVPVKVQSFTAANNW